MSKKDFASMLAAKDNPRTLTASTEKKAKAPRAAASKSTAPKGRPLKDASKGKKRDYCKTINIAVPNEVIEEVNELAIKARGINLTDYINLLIANDLEKNRDKYKKSLSQKNNFD
jgi:hypothetical protein